MEAKSKNKIMKFLPKAASMVRFQHQPFSPSSRDKRSEKAHFGRGFSGPIIPMIPAEARVRKLKSGLPRYDSTTPQEPTSPKVSCMGQIKHKKKIHQSKKKSNSSVSPPKETKPASSSSKVLKKQTSTVRNFFHMGAKKKPDSSLYDGKPPMPDRAPALSQMKRFASGRDTFANFDWTAQVAPVDLDHRKYFSDEDRGDSEGEEEEVMIPFSAPMMIGGGKIDLEPRKEVNLWKRRTMDPPRPLQLNTH